MVTNRVPEVKNGVFRVKIGNLPKRYTGVTLAIWWRYAGITDSRTQIRHRLCRNRVARASADA